MNKATTRKIMSVLATVLVLSVAFVGFAFAETTTGTGGAGSGGTIQFVISMVLLVAIFYFFMIRPEKKRKKKEQELRSSLTVGDDIVTIGGMMGKIVGMSNESITFETGEDRVRIEVAKWAISRKTK